MEHTIRNRKGGETTVPNYSAAKAIRAMCEECMGWEATKYNDIRNCPSVKCPLWPFRGHSRLDIPREITDEQRRQMSERAKKMNADRV